MQRPQQLWVSISLPGCQEGNRPWHLCAPTIMCFVAQAQSNAARQPWTGTSETVSPDTSFLLDIGSSSEFCPSTKNLTQTSSSVGLDASPLPSLPLKGSTGNAPICVSSLCLEISAQIRHSDLAESKLQLCALWQDWDSLCHKDGLGTGHVAVHAVTGLPASPGAACFVSFQALQAQSFPTVRRSGEVGSGTMRGTLSALAITAVRE